MNSVFRHLATRMLFPLLLFSLLGGQHVGWAQPPSAEELPVVEELPDPFQFMDGSRVASEADWLRRRDEIRSMIQYYCYGHLPPAPGNVVAEQLSTETVLDESAIEKRLILSMGPNHAIRVNIRMLIPKGNGPFPVIVANVNQQNDGTPIDRELIERGYAIVVYNRTDLDPDENHQAGPAEVAYPDYDWATLAMWAWGGMRVLDYLETLDEIDCTKAAITGHSRGGKVALLAGALDERFALVVPNGSGCGGSGSFRFVDPQKGETLEAITDPKRFSYWFHPRLRTFAGQVDRLPWDQHFLRALVAPRAMLSTDALGDLWGNPSGTQATYEAAREVFNFLGVPDRQGQHFRPGQHDQLAEDWRALLDFADVVFFGKQVERDFKQTPFANEKKHFTWKMPEKK